MCERVAGNEIVLSDAELALGENVAGLRARVCRLDYPDIAELDAPAVRTEGEDVGHLPMRRHAHAEASRIPVNLGYLLAGRGA